MNSKAGSAGEAHWSGSCSRCSSCSTCWEPEWSLQPSWPPSPVPMRMTFLSLSLPTKYSILGFQNNFIQEGTFADLPHPRQLKDQFALGARSTQQTRLERMRTHAGASPGRWQLRYRPSPAGRSSLCQSWRAPSFPSTPPHSSWRPAWRGSGWSTPGKQVQQVKVGIVDSRNSDECGTHYWSGSISNISHALQSIQLFVYFKFLLGKYIYISIWKHKKLLPVILYYFLNESI